MEHSIEYERGYRDGFMAGEQRGLVLAQRAIALSVQPIIVKCDSKEMADMIIRAVAKGEDE